MSAQHTPGPWQAHGEIGGCLYVSSNGIRIATIHHLHDGLDNEARDAEQEANARLIAAVPDLLSAMPSTNGNWRGGIVKVVAHYADGGTQTIDGDIIEAAIKKATQP